MYQGEGPGLLLTGKHHGGTTGDTGEQRGTGIMEAYAEVVEAVDEAVAEEVRGEARTARAMLN